MAEIGRRDFMRVCGTGLGATALSGLWQDRILAGPATGGGLSIFEERFGVSQELVRKILGEALSKGGDFSELYFEYRIEDSVEMEDDIIKESSEEVSLGVGIRVIKNLKTGYAFTNELTPEAMKRAAQTAAAIASESGRIKVADLMVAKPKIQAYDMALPLADQALGSKIDFVKEAYAAAQNHDSRITKVQVSLTDSIQYITLANSEGLVISDIRPQCRLRTNATAEDNGKRVLGSSNDGGRVGMNFYLKKHTPKDIGKEAAEEALILLEAVDPVAGDQPVVLGYGQSGVMIHEAVGHILEGDGAWKQTSILHDKVGQMVATPLVTIYDDATIPFLRGSLNVDDEGTLTENVTLVDKGKLVGFLHDRISAAHLKAARNGHGRRMSFQNPPIPRMNNTNLAKGKTDPEEIIRSVDKGFYAKSYMGGQVQGTGKFVFSVNLGYLIEGGKITRPVSNATIIGTNVAILKEIEMVGSDYDIFLGTCGKGGQWAPATAGTPTLKISQMTVGGRK